MDRNSRSQPAPTDHQQHFARRAGNRKQIRNAGQRSGATKCGSSFRGIVAAGILDFHLQREARRQGRTQLNDPVRGTAECAASPERPDSEDRERRRRWRSDSFRGRPAAEVVASRQVRIGGNGKRRNQRLDGDSTNRFRNSAALANANNNSGMSYPPPADLKKFLRPYDREVQELALKLRALLLDEMAPCYENIYDAYSAVAIGYGTSERLSDGIFHIAVYAKGANLGFNDGATLDDPKGILEGAGSRIRH